MNFVDIAILLVLSITILGGLYRGFVDTAYNTVATILAWALAMIMIPLVASGIKNDSKLFPMMLYYTEGAEYVAITDIELTRVPIAQVSADTLHTVLANADMPRPMDKAVTKNIATEALVADGITTLGDYFNQTIVCVVINILSVLLLFVVLRVLFGFVIRGMDYGRELVIFALFTTFISDSAAYFIGRTIGRHRLAPAISPRKTWEGAIGGVICTAIASLVLQRWLGLPLSYQVVAVLAVAVSVFGQIGDLAASLFKRNAGAKDSSQVIPGHGGFLDRIDSIIFAGLVVYIYTVFSQGI